VYYTGDGDRKTISPIMKVQLRALLNFPSLEWPTSLLLKRYNDMRIEKGINKNQ
jgi:hypothetical protein